MTDEARTAEQRTQDHTAMGHSADLINDIIAGNQDDLDAADRQDTVDRNVLVASNNVIDYINAMAHSCMILCALFSGSCFVSHGLTP